MNKKKYPSVIISGLGISGLITASLLCKEKIKVECFEPIDISKFHADQRTTAFLNPAIGVFKEIGIWGKIEPFSQPLKEMEIIDAGSKERAGPASVIFEPKEVNIENFGFNVPNGILRLELLRWLKKNQNFVLNIGDPIVKHYAFDDNIVVRTEKGKELNGKLLISCEGRESAIRKREKINIIKTSYNQLAMVFQVSHSKKHKDRTTEILDVGGPFTIIPLRTTSKQSKSTVVWMDNSDVINKAYSLENAEFNTLISKKSLGIRGNIKIVGKRQKWPVSSQFSKTLISKRTVLIAESAHVMPPTGAQGLNTSVEDIIALQNICKTALKNNEDIGSDRVLRQYNIKRFPLTGSKVFGIHLLNKISMTENSFLRITRKKFLMYLNQSSLLRKTLIKAGLGK
tara:strand:- start:263 stop:1459 length:1197 start_codon:yes stop_codon:yes gene_type:complete